MIIKTAVGEIDVTIPDGFSIIETGEVHQGDQFLVGGRHNAWMRNHRWEPYPESEMCTQFSPLTLTIRKKNTTR